mmetsp:Transcript_88402/g.155943  ORF Transcript_88402/g.155943 Transcript_88402/m.155943 type:complete len:87 (-) Transcript_88402:53-313(-)
MARGRIAKRRSRAALNPTGQAVREAKSQAALDPTGEAALEARRRRHSPKPSRLQCDQIESCIKQIVALRVSVLQGSPFSAKMRMAS